MTRSKPCGAKNRHTGTVDAAEELEAAQNLKKDAHGTFQVSTTISLAGQELLFGLR